MAVVLALGAALTYGLSDFVGGLASRRVSPWTVAFLSQVGGAGAVLLLALVVGGDPRGADVGWAVLAGIGNGVGTAFLYRGLSGGRMGVVAPVSGVGAALVPVVVGVASGERPALLAWLGIAAALPAIWLVAREPAPAPGEARTSRGTALLDGVLAGTGFGVLFAAVGQVPEESGFLPLALNQVVGGVVVVAVALALRQAWVPREPAAALGLVCGVLGATASGLFLLATQTGLLTLASVVTSLYPGVTVLLAAWLLRERVHGTQGVGLVLCAAAVALIAAA
ncbi:DMT family transporter [Nocardioides marinquilinus]|uniref:DMT family transporter n=1 Tax=Nocardioides marinquilinus TaxID=1210400 RepID=A0ABP9Q8R5_9ACTN